MASIFSKIIAGEIPCYKVAETENCEFKVKFYQDFVFVNYTKGTCAGQFGHNATVDGIFIKTK